jgi:hypothetical protein
MLDDEQGQPIADAIVSVVGPVTREVRTNQRGIYAISGLPAGDYSIYVMSGVASVTKDVEVPTDGRIRLDLRLKPAD